MYEKYKIIFCLGIACSTSLYGDWETDLKRHDEYWNKNGTKSLYDERHYDGNSARRRWLLEGLEKENKAAADALRYAGPADPVCYRLEEHNKYWEQHGKMPDGKVYDKDWNKRNALLQECERWDKRRVEELKKFLLPSSALIEFEQHVNYWNDRGHDWDPIRFKVLYEGAKNIDPAKAEEIAMKAPFSAIFFVEQIAQGKVPLVFQLKGKLSSAIRTASQQLSQGLPLITSAPNQFFEMYYQLGMRKWDLSKALTALEDGKKILEQAQKEVNNNILIRGTDLKKELESGFESFQKALPEIERVLKGLYQEINVLEPDIVPQQHASQESFNIAVKDAAQKHAQKAIGNQVQAVKQVLERREQGVTVLEALQSLPIYLEERNL